MHTKKGTIIAKILHFLEHIIAIITLVALLYLLVREIYCMFTVADYFATTDTYLKNVLTIVVGLEFVRMLIDLTPANTIEVLIVAMARQVILTHNDPLGSVACIACIAGLFAIRKFLVSKKELTVELSEVE